MHVLTKFIAVIISRCDYPHHTVPMKSAHGLQAPSTSLLRFLRCQLHLDAQPILAAITPRQPKLSLSRQCRQITIPTSNRTHSAPARTQTPSTTHDCHYTHRRDFTSQPPLREGFWRRLRPSSNTGAGSSKSLRPEDLPPLSGFLDDHAGLGGKIVKPSNELKLRCTEFDENGNVTLTNADFRKSELIAKVRQLPYTFAPHASRSQDL